ncbi:trigger factor [Rhizocola hellebori]|uniref:Trigger factor n=1 Tax=Rhizocola hellebori TaxID=1392758 RepID=A0A8J3VK39_9ACTN|nr:trigger factor [Rhizocola hellebori]GIH10044.1 trigger factor [Rhizocola hellebori]
MKSTVETLSPTRVRLAIEVPFAELEPSLKKAYREIASQVNIPGFRQGKVPAQVIDQRVGRGAVLQEAIEDVIPAQIFAAVREHDVKLLGRPSVDNLEFADGQPLKFTAEVDVRPELTLPELSSIKVEVDPLAVGESEINEQLDALREKFVTLKTVERAAVEGDFVQLDLNATVDGAEVEGGTATNLSHQVGSGTLLKGLDEAVVGLSAGETATFVTALVGGEHAGSDADVLVTVRTVKERELPALDDDFAQLASEFDTLDELRGDLEERITRVKKVEQLYAARDKALAELVVRASVPAPEGVVADEVAQRKQAMVDQLERMGASLEEYLSVEDKTEEQIDSDLAEAAAEGVKIQLVLDTIAEAENVDVSDDEFGHEIVHRAQRAGMQPQQYYDELVKAGAAAAVYGDVRRGKALALVMERVIMTDTNGEVLSLDALRTTEDHSGHDHGDHEGHNH